MNIRTVLLVGAVLVVATSQAIGGRLEILASSIASIEPADKSESARILVKWEPPSSLVGAKIEAAAVRMKLDYDSSIAFQVDVIPMTKSWTSASVAWSSGWTKDGGDYDEEWSSPGIVTDNDNGEFTADVRAILRDQIAGKKSNLGFIIIVSSGEKALLKSFDADDTARLASAKLIISYRNRQ